MKVPGEYKNPRQFTVRKTTHPRQLLPERTSTIRQDCQSPEITGSKNIYCPARAGNPRQLLSGQMFLRTVDLRMNKSPELPYYARLFESPELYWSFYKLCWNEAPLRRPFLKILYENADKYKKELDADTLKTSNLSNKIICRPPQSRETIPLSEFGKRKKVKNLRNIPVEPLPASYPQNYV